MHFMRRAAGAFLGFLLAAAAAGAQEPPPAADPRAPVPAPEEQEAIRKVLQDIFRADYARKTPEGMKALARKLLEQLPREKDPATRYVLLREAAELSARGGDPAGAVEAADRLGRQFRLDARGLKAELLEAAAKAAPGPAAAKAAAEAYGPLVEAAAAEEDYDAARALAGKALAAARKAQDAALVLKLQAQEKEITALRADFLKVKAHLRALEDNPNDPEANLAAGAYYCFQRDRWDKGLPHLAKGSDPALAEAAILEAGEPKEPKDRATLARAWREAAGRQKGRAKEACEQRALFWYEAALGGMKGVERLELQQEVDRFSKTLSGGLEGMPSGLVFWVEPGRSPGAPLRELRLGLRGEETGTGPAPGGAPAVLFSGKDFVVYPAAGAAAAFGRTGSIFAWIRTDAPEQFGCVINRCENRQAGPEDFGFYVRRGHLNVYFNWEPPDRPPIGSSEAEVPADRWFLGGASWDERALTFWADGKRDNTIPLAGRAPPLARGPSIVLGVSVPGGVEYYQGLLGSAMVFSRALTDAEVGRLFAQGRARFR